MIPSAHQLQLCICIAGEAKETVQQLLQSEWLERSLSARSTFAEAAMQVLNVLYNADTAIAAADERVPAIVISQVDLSAPSTTFPGAHIVFTNKHGLTHHQMLLSIMLAATYLPQLQKQAVRAAYCCFICICWIRPGNSFIDLCRQLY